jgi:hypothetical protein
MHSRKLLQGSGATLRALKTLRKELAMADVAVTCVTKPNVNSAHEHITHLGNPTAGWKWTREQVIQSIDAKSNTFYVQDPASGKKAYIGVVRENGKAAYLRTYADGQWNNNLLSLNQCPLG